jgi:hypothetical protein
MTLNEVAIEVRRSAITLRRWIKEGIRGIRLRAVVHGGTYVVRRGDLDAFFEQLTRQRIGEPLPIQQSESEFMRQAKAAQRRLAARLGHPMPD